jgi:type I restriction enzyme M protein
VQDEPGGARHRRDIKWNNEGSFLNDAFPTLKFDYAMANPPFNISDWWQPQLEATSAGNTAAARRQRQLRWLQHILHHLAPRGTAGVVLANGSMSSQQSGEGEIRKAMIEGDVVDCMVALPGQLLFHPDSACLWFLARDKSANATATGAAKSCSSMLAALATWWTALGASSRKGHRRQLPAPTTAGGGQARRRTGRVSGHSWFCKSATLEEVRARPCPHAGPICRRGGCRGRRRALCRTLCCADRDPGRSIQRSDRLTALIREKLAMVVPDAD